MAAFQLPASVTTHFADRMHRLHHAIWHGLRNTWDVISLDKRTAIEALGWTPPRPGRQWAAGSPNRPYLTNGSGIDFLYFHREMLIHYRMLMAEAGETPISWVEIPAPGDAPGKPASEVPAAWTVPGNTDLERRIAALKTDEFFWSRMRWSDQQFKDPTYLATLTLGELGALLEYSVHNDMHLRWSAVPRDPETNEALPTGRPMRDIAPKWDDPRYDSLFEFYSSHVHPFFWRLHGWVDDRIEDWFETHAQRHPGAIERETHGGVSWFKPGAWVEVTEPWVWPAALAGGHHVSPDLRQQRIASMEAVVAVLWPPVPPPVVALDEAEPAAMTTATSSNFDLVFTLPL